jgi:hypothetical protein
MVVVEDDYFNLVGGMYGWAVAYRAYLCSAEDIYILADGLLLDNLKHKSLDFLELTCTKESITAHTLEFASLYPEVRDMYVRCFSDNKDVMNDPEALQKFFSCWK